MVVVPSVFLVVSDMNANERIDSFSASCASLAFSVEPNNLKDSSSSRVKPFDASKDASPKLLRSCALVWSNVLNCLSVSLRPPDITLVAEKAAESPVPKRFLNMPAACCLNSLVPPRSSSRNSFSLSVIAILDALLR